MDNHSSLVKNGVKNTKKNLQSQDSIKKITHKRRKHTNSRLGCTNCKKRQIKCDETLPVCNTCLKKNEPCSYMFLSADKFQHLINSKNSNEHSSNNDESINFDNFVESTTNEEDYEYFSLLKNKEMEVYNTLRQDEHKITSSVALNNLTETKKHEFIGPSFSSRYFDHLVKKPLINANSVDAIPTALSTAILKPQQKIDLSHQFPNTQSLPDQPYVSFIVPNEMHIENQIFASMVDQDLETSIENLLGITHTNDINEQISPKFERIYATSNDEIFEFEKLQKEIILNNDENSMKNSEPESHHDNYKYDDDYAEINSPLISDVSGSDYYESRPGSVSGSSSDSESYVQRRRNIEINLPSPFKVYTPAFQPETDDYEPLPSARTVDKTFKILPTIPERLSYMFEIITSPRDQISEEHIQYFREKYNITDFDEIYYSNYKILCQFLILFSKLVRKATILYIIDVTKNILYKQKTILRESLNDDSRIRICGVCEKISVIELSELTNLINNDYIKTYSRSTKAIREIIMTSFVTLAICTSYHYNSGYRQNISVEQSNQCIKFIGTFISGMFSIVINENKIEPENQVKPIIRLSNAFLDREKLVIIDNFNSDIVKEVYQKLYLLKLFKIDKFNDKIWSNPYTNLMLFLEKHSQFLKVYKKRSLLGYDKGYLIRMINEWLQIHPHDLVNLTKFKQSNRNISQDKEIQIIIYLTFICVRYVLQAIVPAIRTLVRNSFTSSTDMPYDLHKNILNCYKMLKNRDHKIYAIYIIRTLTFMKLRCEGTESMLRRLHIPEFFNSGSMPTSEKCSRLLNDWKYGDAINEIMKNSFDLKGEYLTKSNYPRLNTDEVQIKEEETVKIRFRSKFHLIHDFEKLNNGLLSQDYDPRIEKIKEINEIPSDNGKFQLLKPGVSEVSADSLMNCWNIENFIKMNKGIV